VKRTGCWCRIWSPLDETLDALRYQAARGVEQGRSAAGAVMQGLSRLVRGPRSALQDAALVGITSDRAAVPDARAFARCLEDGMDEVLALG
jgi:hypothetical protein